MTSRFIDGGWYGDHLPSGAFCVTVPEFYLETHAGIVPLPPGEPWGIGYPRCTDVGGFRFAGQAHSTGNLTWERAGASWREIPGVCCGVSPVIYDHDGVLHISQCGPVGSQGYRYVTDDNQLVTGDETYGPFHGMSEYTDLGDGLWIGQGHELGGVLVLERTYDAQGRELWTLRRLAEGVCTFVRANRDGAAVALAYSTPDGVYLPETTMAELRALPVVSTPTPEPPDPEPPTPEPPDPPTPEPPHPPIDPPIDPPRPPAPFRTHTKGLAMEIDGKIVQLRGAGGRLIAPDLPNTGTWGSLNEGWRGVVYSADGAAGTRHRAAKLSNGRYSFLNVDHSGYAGADGGQYSPALDRQGYYMPDGRQGPGELEQWRVYDGNENGAIEAQIEQSTDSNHPAGAGKKFFAFPLTVEIVS